MRNIVASKLILDWSPEQISGWLKSQYPDDESLRVSHETIYRSLFIQARGVLKKEAVAAILPAGNRPVPHLSSAARPGLAARESTPKKNLRVPDSCE